MEKILQAGIAIGVQPKVHVNQFSSLGGIKKAVELNALSVDHLEELADADIEALKGSSVMPTILPSCSHFLSIPFGDARRLMDNDLPVALASDFNPGSTPSGNLSFVWSLACVKMKMTPEEALNALTINAAYAMGLTETHGTITIGKKTAVLLTIEIPILSYIPYSFGDQLIERLIIS
jgi:imidazolonepropionase